MKPIEFEGQNVVFAKDQPEYLPLPAQVCDNVYGQVVTCWELTEEEIATIATTGKIWVSMLSFKKPLMPIELSIVKPEPLT